MQWSNCLADQYPKKGLEWALNANGGLMAGKVTPDFWAFL